MIRTQGLTVQLCRYKVTYGPEEDTKEIGCLTQEEANNLAKLLSGTVSPIDPDGDAWMDGITLPADTTNPMAAALAIKDAGEAAYLSSIYIPSPVDSVAALGRVLVTTLELEDGAKVAVSGLYEDWSLGKYAVGDIRNQGGQTWECYQAHDNATHPDIVPGNPAWYTFWRPLHGACSQTARPYVAPTGAHDIYHAGEYMIYTDGKTYRCIQDSAYSPDDQPSAWETA